MEQRIHSDIRWLRLKAKRNGTNPCKSGCPFGGDCEICCYLFPTLFDNYMVKRPNSCDNDEVYRLHMFNVNLGYNEPCCPCLSLDEGFVTWRIALFMEKGGDQMNSRPFFNGMKEHFGITKEANTFLDATMLALGKVSIDMLQLDFWLHEQVGEYEKKEGLSMKEAISKYYGERAVDFVELFM